MGNRGGSRSYTHTNLVAHQLILRKEVRQTNFVKTYKTGCACRNSLFSAQTMSVQTVVPAGPGVVFTEDKEFQQAHSIYKGGGLRPPPSYLFVPAGIPYLL